MKPRPWERVHTIDDWYDGPREGVADCQGIPHAFTCAWDSVADDWDTVFRLSPLTSRQFDDVLEAWAIWKRWREAFDAGRLRESDRHPALAEEHTRWDELQARLKAAKRADDDATSRLGHSRVSR